MDENTKRVTGVTATSSSSQLLDQNPLLRSWKQAKTTEKSARKKLMSSSQDGWDSFKRKEEHLAEKEPRKESQTLFMLAWCPCCSSRNEACEQEKVETFQRMNDLV